MSEIHTTVPTLSDTIKYLINSGTPLLDIVSELQDHIESLNDSALDEVRARRQEIEDEIKDLQRNYGEFNTLQDRYEEMASQAQDNENWGSKQHQRAEHYKAYCEKHMLITDTDVQTIDKSFEH